MSGAKKMRSRTIETATEITSSTNIAQNTSSIRDRNTMVMGRGAGQVVMMGEGQRLLHKFRAKHAKSKMEEMTADVVINTNMARNVFPSMPSGAGLDMAAAAHKGVTDYTGQLWREKRKARCNFRIYLLLHISV
uniref:Uncharacterized protein n=1 Tax=Branchiostoma floridae TaxID=7739 RepID=C3YX85_BRAFL|eukprot:XP_002599091.1 hypothetical protein BRAFLDRAFT_81754 [Branchiostoma floridae]